MLSATPTSPTRSGAAPRLSRLGWVVIALAFALYGVLLARHMGAYAGGSDSSGYMNHARLLGRGHIHVAARAIPQLTPPDESGWLYSALGFKPAADGNGLVPTYPSGLPLSILAVAQLVGWHNAGNVTLWLYGMVGVLLTYAAGRAFGLTPRVALIAAVVIAGSPLYLFMTLQTMSDVPALVWTTAAILAALKSRARAGWAAAGGAAFAMAVLVRPTNILAIVPLAVALGWSWRRWVAFGAAGLPGAVFFCLESHSAYGSYFTTGYGAPDDFSMHWVGMTLRHYAHWLPLELTPLIFAFVALPFFIRRLPLKVTVLVCWVLAYAGFYATYSFTHETWWYLRFLLPIAPALVIGALLVLAAAKPPTLSPRWATAVACAALVAVFGWNKHWMENLNALDSGSGEGVYPETAAWMNAHLPDNAVVAAMQASGAMFYYTDFTFFRWDAIDAHRFAEITQAVTATHRPLYAVLFPFDLEQNALTEHMRGGTWKQVGTVRDVTIWQWSPPS